MVDDASINKVMKGDSVQSKIIHEANDESMSLKTESEDFGFDVGKGEEILKRDMELIEQLKSNYMKKGSFF